MFILKRIVARVARRLRGRKVPAPWVRAQAIEGLEYAAMVLRAM